MNSTGRSAAYIEYSAFSDCDITHDVIQNQCKDDVIMMSWVSSCVMLYNMVVSNNRGFYGTLAKKKYLGMVCPILWVSSILSDPSNFYLLFHNFRHKNSIFSINLPLGNTVSGTIIIIFTIIIIVGCKVPIRSISR